MNRLSFKRPIYIVLILIALGILPEIMLRIVTERPFMPGDVRGLCVADDTLGYRHNPNFHTVIETASYRTEITINSKGL